MLITKLPFVLWFACCYVCFASLVLAQGPENTFVVVNADSPDSLAVANRYVSLRDIPAGNVLYLNGITTVEKWGDESTTSSRFKKQVLDPLLKSLKDRGLEEQIDCVAYSSGFPTRINFQPEMKTCLKQTGEKYAIGLHAPWLSITSLTYFYRNVFSKSPNFLELDTNHYANPRRMKILANPFVDGDLAKYESAIKNARSGDVDEAIEQLMYLARVHPEQITVTYWLAKCFAAKGDTEKAANYLSLAEKAGFASRSLLLNDKAFSEMRSLSSFKEITNRMEDLPDGVIPTRSFSAQQYWAKNGWANGTTTQGERYLLSSILAVTEKNQSTLKASPDRLESSATVDGANLQGDVYFADHKDVRSRTRSRQFPFAVEELESIGHKASIRTDIYPIADPRVIGATLGSAAPKWNMSKSKFLPGAICDNLTSYGAWWKKAGQTHVSEWLDAGASGTVYEPRAISAKFPTARWHSHYARGSTLAESYYQSVTGPFQLLLVVDPLCCPFGNFPKFEIKGLTEGASVAEDFVLQIDQAANSPAVRGYQIFYDGLFLAAVPNTDKITVATDDMSDGYHELRIVGVADSPIANKRSKKTGVFFKGTGQTINLDIESSQVKLG